MQSKDDQESHSSTFKLKRQLSYKLSFSSYEDMTVAFDMLASSEVSGCKIDVIKVADDL